MRFVDRVHKKSIYHYINMSLVCESLMPVDELRQQETASVSALHQVETRLKECLF
jgi:hypothetical protein